MMRLGFSTRLALIVVTSLLAIQILAVIAWYAQRGRSTETGFRMPLPDQVAAIVQLAEKTPPGERLALLRALNGPNLRVRIVTGKADTPPPETWQQSPFVERTLRRYLSVLGEREVTVLVEKHFGPFEQKRWVAFAAPAAIAVHVALTTGETLVIDAAGHWLSVTIFGLPPGFWAGVGGVIIALLTVWVVRREARPLRRLAAAVDSLQVSAPGEPLPDAPRSAPEIRALIGAFNRMKARITALLRARFALVGGISHDLRTYATRLRLRAEKITDDAERAKAVRDIDDMIALLDDALLAIKDGAGVQAQEQELADIAEILNREVDDRRPQGADISLTIHPGPPLLVLGDPLSLRRMISNVTENAIRYGHKAAVHAWTRADTVIVTIDDSGPGIPPELRQQMTEPFVRADVSRNRETGGAGLGLAIARNAADAHGGSLEIGDAPGGGARITMRLPLFSPSQQGR